MYPRRVCARRTSCIRESVCSCIRRSRSRYLRRAEPRPRSIMYQLQMCISPAGCRTMIHQCDTRGLMGRMVTRVHTGERAPSLPPLSAPLVFSPPPPALPVIAKYALIRIPYRDRWRAIWKGPARWRMRHHRTMSTRTNRVIFVIEMLKISNVKYWRKIRFIKNIYMII